MAHLSETRLLVLQGLRLKGFGEPPAIGAAVGLDETVVEEHLAKLQAEELVLRRDGRLSGWALTRDGRAEQERLVTEELVELGLVAEVRHAYERFLALNQGMLAACTDWQVRAEAPNDHTDAAYDNAVDRTFMNGLQRALGFFSQSR